MPEPPARERTFTLPELAEISGIDYRTLHNWQKRGLLSPSHQSANGSGHTNLFDLHDALQIYVLADLRKKGIEVRVLERIAPQLRELVERLDGEELLLFDRGVEVLEGHEKLDRAVRERGSALIYSPARARAALQRA